MFFFNRDSILIDGFSNSFALYDEGRLDEIASHEMLRRGVSNKVSPDEMWVHTLSLERRNG